MGGKSDEIRYASEIPTVIAWDPTYTDNNIKKAKQIALATHETEYNINLKVADKHKELIESDMITKKFKKITNISWQANFNRNNNGSPADIVFENHVVGGVSVKCGSDIIKNFGKESGLGIKPPRGMDLFQMLAPAEFTSLIYRIKTDLIEQLSIGDSWTKARDTDYGKYSITCTGQDTYTLKYGSGTKTLTKEQLLTEVVLDKKNKEKKVSNKWRRVFGDFYQDNKKKYKVERDNLFNILYPIIVDLVVKNIFSDHDKLCDVSGFTEKAYYVSDLDKNKIYFVPSKDTVLKNIQIEIFNKDKDRSFGSGFELGCRINLTNSKKYATIDFYICYNGGTFKGSPIIKIQNFQNKEALWQEIL